MYFQIITALLALITSLVGLATAVISCKSKTKENDINKQPSKTSITVKGHDNVVNNTDNTSFNNTTYNQSTINQYLAKSDDDGSIVYLISFIILGVCYLAFRNHPVTYFVITFATAILFALIQIFYKNFKRPIVLVSLSLFFITNLLWIILFYTNPSFGFPTFMINVVISISNGFWIATFIGCVLFYLWNVIMNKLQNHIPCLSNKLVSFSKQKQLLFGICFVQVILLVSFVFLYIYLLTFENLCISFSALMTVFH